MSTAAQDQFPDADLVINIVKEWQDKPGALLPILHGIQDALGFVPADAVPLIAGGLNLSRAEVHGVISFYHYFRSTPPGRHIIRICRAESCQAMGGRQLETHVRQSLNIDYHQTSADGQITLQPVYCLGNCACSPAIQVGDEIHSHVDPVKFNTIVDQLLTRPLEVT